MLLFASIGIAIALYDSVVIFNNRLLWCPPPIDGCNTVAYSPYAFIFKLPVGYFGTIYYLFMFAIVVLLAYDPFSRGLRLGTLLFAALGMALSMGFMFIQLTLIKAFCIYCMVAFVMTGSLFISSLAHFRATRRPNLQESKFSS